MTSNDKNNKSDETPPNQDNNKPRFAYLRKGRGTETRYGRLGRALASSTSSLPARHDYTAVMTDRNPPEEPEHQPTILTGRSQDTVCFILL